MTETEWLKKSSENLDARLCGEEVEAMPPRPMHLQEIVNEATGQRCLWMQPDMPDGWKIVLS